MNLANKISIARIILIPFFIAAIVYSRLGVALFLFMLAVISDAADGFIARALKQKTEFGTILDPIADKLLLMSAYITLSIANLRELITIPPYVMIVVISRDVIIVLGSIMIYMIKGSLEVSPSIVGKITTFFQMMTIVSVLVQFNHSAIVWNIAVTLTIASGIDYLVKGSRLFNDSHHIKNGTT
ncbi:MAG: CDP-alcohol phosphatidyltransferase family protein [Candidatus Omnitrophota bacterium]